MARRRRVKPHAPFADDLILQAIAESGGAAVAVDDREIREAARRIRALEGVDVCPEGGATIAALRHLLDGGLLDRDETVVVFNCGSGLKYR